MACYYKFQNHDMSCQENFTKIYNLTKVLNAEFTYSL